MFSVMAKVIEQSALDRGGMRLIPVCFRWLALSVLVVLGGCVSAPLQSVVKNVHYTGLSSDVKTGETLTFDVLLKVQASQFEEQHETALKASVMKQLNAVSGLHSLREVLSTQRSAIETKVFDAVSADYSQAEERQDDELKFGVTVLALSFEKIHMPELLDKKIRRFQSLKEKIIGYQNRIQRQERYINQLPVNDEVSENVELLKAKMYLGKLKSQQKTLIKEYQQLAQELKFE